MSPLGKHDQVSESRQHHHEAGQQEGRSGKGLQGGIIELPEHRISSHRGQGCYDGQEGEDLSDLVAVERLGEQRPDDRVLDVADGVEAADQVHLPKDLGERCHGQADGLNGHGDEQDEGVVEFQLGAQEGCHDHQVEDGAEVVEHGVVGEVSRVKVFEDKKHVEVPARDQFYKILDVLVNIFIR